MDPDTLQLLSDLANAAESGLGRRDEFQSDRHQATFIVHAILSEMENHIPEAMEWLGLSSGNPSFDAALEKMRATYRSKNSDYANLKEPYFTFERVGAMLGIDPVRVFLVLLGVKLSRLTQLTSSGEDPENEPLLDSVLDLANYATILYAYLTDRKRT